MSNKTAMQSKESWQRLWLPLANWDAAPRMGDDFLTPDGEPFASQWASRQEVSGIQRLEDYGGFPFLLLLGRPGAGKSEELKRAHQENALGKSILITGKEIGASDPGQKIQQLIQADFPQENDREGLRILFDGLDEVLLSNREFVSNLKAWMRLHKNAAGHPKYRLVISTRWANWPEMAVKELAELWPQPDFLALVLAPLKRDEVFATLKNRYGDAAANQFWHQMSTRRLQPLACWPQSLLGLMSGFEKTGKTKLAQSYAEAVGDLVVSLCALTDNPDDNNRWEASIPDREWRQHLAGRLAATMVFTGRAKLSLNAGNSSEALQLADLKHTDEIWNNTPKPVELKDVDQLVNRTGLLKRLGSDHLWVFQSQVYQEWLAADWLHKQKVDLPRLQNVFGHSSDGGWKAYTEVKTVACWLAAMNVSFRQLLLDNDPLVLLGMDAGTLPESEREKVVEAILKATHEARAIDHTELEQSHIGSLSHPNLEAQLLKWLNNPSVHETAKELAVEIAQHADLYGIVPHLWDLLPQSSGRYRIELAHALGKLATDEASIPKWKAVLDRELPLDENGDILGYALEHLVLENQHVPLRNALSSVFPEHDFRVIGNYRMVCLRLHEAMTPDDVPAVLTALKKAEIHSDYQEFHIPGNFCNRALKLALENIQRPDIATSLADFWHHSLKRYLFLHEMVDLTHLSIAGQDLQERRRTLINVLIHHPAFDTQQGSKYLLSRHYLFIPEDIEWCLDEILKAKKTDDAWRYALAVADFVWEVPLSGAVSEKFDQAYARSHYLKKLLPAADAGKSVLETISTIVDSRQKRQEADVAKRLKRTQQQQAAFQKRLAESEKAYRENHESGHLVWPGVLTMLGARKHGQGSFTVKLGLADEVHENEEWIKEAAKRYIVERPIQSSIEEVNDIYPLLALAVVPTALHAAGPAQDSIRTHWLVPLIRCMTDSALEKESAGLNRARLAQLFPGEFALAFGQIMRSRYQQGSSLSEVRGFLDFWSVMMTEQLKQILAEEVIQPRSFPTALKYLFMASPDAAIEVSKSWLAKTQDLPEEPRTALLGGSLLYLEGALTQEIKLFLEKSEQAAKAFGIAIGSLDFMERRLNVSAWSNDALKSLVEIAWKAFPKWEKHRSSGWSGSLGGVSPFELAVEFRNHITHVARERGLDIVIPRPPADDQSEDAQELQNYANWHEHVTERKLSGAGWQPCSPQEFLHFVHMPNARLAKDNDELQVAVIESLQRWEARLQGGHWKRLWDETSQKAKAEDRISDEMREWLNDDLKGVFAEREVKLLQDTRTDVLVEVPARNPHAQPLALVIEVKKVRDGNKRERLNAAGSQLLDRYLIPRQHEGWTHGLLLVAWTPIPGSATDTEEAKTKEADLLSEQAEKLTKDPFCIQSMVLDARFDGSSSSRNPKKKSRQSNSGTKVQKKKS